MEIKVLETREQGNLRERLILNTFKDDSDYNFSLIRTLIKGNRLLEDNAVLSHETFDTMRKARNKFNKGCKDWFIMPNTQ